MNICIICTWFAPDTAVAAKRPYMFAKYLTEFGHTVTVIRSGEINKARDRHFSEEDCGFQILSYLGLEKETGDKPAAQPKSRFGFLPLPLRKVILFIYEPIRVINSFKRSNFHFKKLQELARSLHSDTQFDVVISTYGELANIKAGKYFSSLFGCPWVLDFRDRVIQPSNSSFLWKVFFASYERMGIKEADAVTSVSRDLFFDYQSKEANFHTIYNGYDGSASIQDKYENGKLVLCYTGQIYLLYYESLHFLFSIIKKLCDSREIDINMIEFRYAGPNGTEIFNLASKYGVGSIVRDYGYLSPDAVSELQEVSDIFVVFSWNTKTDRGIITGKFFEGIKVKKQILAIVSGDEPESELYRMNREYGYGYCVDLPNRDGKENGLENYLKNSYQIKMTQGALETTYSQDFIDKFCYKNLTKELEEIINGVVASNRNCQ